MSIVRNIIAESRIGQTSGGFWVNAVRVEYKNGLTGTLYRLNRGDGKIYGLQSEKPAILECCQVSLMNADCLLHGRLVEEGGE